MSQTEARSLPEIASRTRYPVDAFHFVRRGLDYTVHRIHADPARLPEQSRHVSGRQLSEGLRDFALDQYGDLATIVLRRWRIHRTEDFGHIVFAMVEGGLMQATPDDTPTDFDSVFSFDEAFEAPIRLDGVPPEGLSAEERQQVGGGSELAGQE